MRTCPECNTEFEDEKSFCPNCGKYMPKIKNPYPTEVQKPSETVSKTASAPIAATAVEMSTDLENELSKPFTYEIPAEAEHSKETEPVEQPKVPDFEIPDIPPMDYSEMADAQNTCKENTPSVLSFVLTLILFYIPVVNLVYAIALAFGATKYPAKKNLARGIFLFVFIVAVLLGIAGVILLYTLGEDALLGIFQQAKGYFQGVK